MIKRSEKGSITLFTLIAMMFLLTIAFTAYTSAMIKLQAQNEDLERIKASYEQDLTPEGLAKLYNELTGTREWLPGEGTEQNPYRIYTIEDLLTLSNKTNEGENYSGKYIELMNDLDLRNVKSYEKADRTDFGDVNNNGIIEELRTELTTGEGWKPIGTSTKFFNGIFLGNKYCIKEMYINTIKDCQALFGVTKNAKIKDLSVEGKIYSKGNAIGGIIGYLADGSEIENCINIVEINQITDSLNGATQIGGIAGNSRGRIINCINKANIKVEVNMQANVGGIVGGNSSIVEKCQNYGEIDVNLSDTANSNIGGIVGRSEGGSTRLILECCNNGKIVGNSGIGGIAGVVVNTQVINSYNTGEIKSIKNNNYCGGVVGDNYGDNSKVEYSYSIGNIIVNNEINGRVVGACVNGAIVKRCYGLSEYSYIVKGFNGTASSSNVIECELKQNSEFKLQSFVDLLNSNQEAQFWTMDTININNGYPILKWQLQN